MLKDLKDILRLEIKEKSFKIIYLLCISRDYIYAKYGMYNLYLYKIGDDLIGYSIIRDNVLIRIIVNEKYRNNKVGTYLVPHYVMMVTASESSIGFYEKLGFIMMDKNRKVMMRCLTDYKNRIERNDTIA